MVAGGASLRCLATRLAAVQENGEGAVVFVEQWRPGRAALGGQEGSADASVGSCWLLVRYAPSDMHRDAWVE